MSLRVLLEEHWLPAQRSRGLRPATLDQYRMVVECWLVPRIGAVKVQALTPATVQGLVEDLRTERSTQGRPGLSARSAQLVVSVLKSACSWGLRNGVLGRNPAVAFDRPRLEHKPMAAWTTEEAAGILGATSEDRLAFGWALLLCRGLRRGELCGLRWDDVDLNGNVLRVTGTRVVVDGQVLCSTPKTASGRRSIPIDAHLLALLKGHRKRQLEERLAAGPAYDEGGWLVADELGHPYNPQAISKLFVRRAKAAGLRPIRLHDLRHTSASLMLADGVPTKVVSELLGHASPTITLAIYAHVMPGQAGQAGAALSDRLLSRSAKTL